MLQWCRGHLLQELVQQDAFTARAASKPRGYAGDAVMMDFIYRGTPPAGTTVLGADVFLATTCAGIGLSMRNEAAMRAMAEAAGATQIATFHDPHRNVVYAELQRGETD